MLYHSSAQIDHWLDVSNYESLVKKIEYYIVFPLENRKKYIIGIAERFERDFQAGTKPVPFVRSNSGVICAPTSPLIRINH